MTGYPRTPDVTVNSERYQRSDLQSPRIMWPVWVSACIYLLVFDRDVLCQDAVAPDEYCQWEAFNASCTDQPDHVILMTSARYGRMRFGRCMREDHGSVGCSADVLPQLDRKCSGRTTCHVTIPDATLHNVHPCPRELMPYLEASYVCLPVRTWIAAVCDWMGDSPFSSARSSSSFIAAIGPAELAASSADCPWSVRARPGQRLNVTVHFGLSAAAGSSDDGTAAASGPGRDSSAAAATSTSGVACSLNVVVADGNRTVTLTPPCGADRHRERQTYSSTGNELKVYVQHLTSVDDPESAGGELTGFILQYKAFGCADISAIAQASVTRTADTTVVKCNLTGETYFLTCKDSVWKGELYNCTKAGVAGALHSSVSYTYGLLVIIGIGVSLGVAVGVVMLFGIVVCIRRKQIDKPPLKLRCSHSATENPLLARYRDTTSSLDRQVLDQTLDADDRGGIYSCTNDVSWTTSTDPRRSMPIDGAPPVWLSPVDDDADPTLRSGAGRVAGVLALSAGRAGSTSALPGCCHPCGLQSHQHRHRHLPPHPVIEYRVEDPTHLHCVSCCPCQTCSTATSPPERGRLYSVGAPTPPPPPPVIGRSRVATLGPDRSCCGCQGHVSTGVDLLRPSTVATTAAAAAAAAAAGEGEQRLRTADDAAERYKTSGSGDVAGSGPHGSEAGGVHYLSAADHSNQGQRSPAVGASKGVANVMTVCRTPSTDHRMTTSQQANRRGAVADAPAK